MIRHRTQTQKWHGSVSQALRLAIGGSDKTYVQIRGTASGVPPIKDISCYKNQSMENLTFLTKMVPRELMHSPIPTSI
jgi:hypothetical protein